MASYLFSSNSYAIPIATSNTLAGPGLFTAANPSSANGMLGSSAVLNWGAGAVLLAPSLTGSGNGTITYGSDPALPGTAILINPITGQTLGSYTFVLPTTDLTTNIISIGSLSINATTATVPILQATTVQASNLFLSNLSGNYFIANGVSVNVGVYMTISGIQSDLIVSGPNSPTKLQLQFFGGTTLISASTSSGVIVIGSPGASVNALMTLHGKLNIAGSNYTDKFTIDSGGTSFLALDTINGTFLLSNVAATLTLDSYMVIGGPSNVAKLQVQNGSSVVTFNVDTADGYVLVAGEDSGTTAYKFAVNNSAGVMVFGVQTDSAASGSEQIVSRTIMPVSGTDRLGSPSNPWTMYGTVIPPSDPRLKTKGRELSGTECVEFLRAVDLNWFTYLAEERAGINLQHIGMMTDNIRAVAPGLAEALIDSSESFDGLSLYSLVSVLAGAVKHLLLS